MNIFLPTTNTFAYCCSVKICPSGFDKLLESTFCLLLVVEAFSLQKKIVEMLEELVVGWRGVRWRWQMRQNVVAQFVQLLKRWVCGMQPGIISKGNWALSDDHCQRWGFPCISLICWACFSDIVVLPGFRKLVDHTGSRPPNSDHDHLFGTSLALGSAFELLLCPATELVIPGCHTNVNPLFITHHNQIEKWFTVVA